VELFSVELNELVGDLCEDGEVEGVGDEEVEGEGGLSTDQGTGVVKGTQKIHPDDGHVDPPLPFEYVV
jgi:hypothetical protein